MGTIIVTVLGVMAIIAITKCMISGFMVLGYVVAALFAAIMIGEVVLCKDDLPMPKLHKKRKIQEDKAAKRREAVWDFWVNNSTLKGGMK